MRWTLGLLLILLATPAWAQSGGGGGVRPTGAPTNHQVPVWTNGTTIKGITPDTAGKVLTSNGTGADPSFQAVAGTGNTTSSLTAGKVPKADGTNSIVDSAISDNGSGTVTVGTGAATGALQAGSFLLTGTTSGIVTVLPQAAAGTFNFNLPITAGSSGDLLVSGGGTSAPMTWLTPPAAALVGTTASQTLTNKTIVATSNTLSAIAGSMMTNNTVASAQMAVVNNRRVCSIVVGADNGTALVDGDLAQADQCYIPYAATVVEVFVKADAGTPNVIAKVTNVANSSSNLTSSALATASSGARACANAGGTTGLDATTTCSGTLQNTSVAAGSTLGLASGTAGATAKKMVIAITYTVN